MATAVAGAALRLPMVMAEEEEAALSGVAESADAAANPPIEKEEEEEAADFSAAGGAEGVAGDNSDSDSCDSDGLPPLDPYWASMLNVSKVPEPLSALPPPDVTAVKDGKGRGKEGKGGGKGFKGSKSKKGGRKGKQRDEVGDFFNWALDPTAEDGSRPWQAPRAGISLGRDRSRSPRRRPDGSEGGAVGGGSTAVGSGTGGAPARSDGKRLEDFMSWARDGVEAKREPEPEAEGVVSGSAADLGSFMAWAAKAEAPEAQNDEPADAVDEDHGNVAAYPGGRDDLADDLTRALGTVLPEPSSKENEEGIDRAVKRHKFEDDKDDDED